MWSWVDHLGLVLVRASFAAVVLSSLVVLAMLGCRQPVRRIALARAAMLGLLTLIPLVALSPSPRLGVFAGLRWLGLWPHPLFSMTGVDAIGAGWVIPGLAKVEARSGGRCWLVC